MPRVQCDECGSAVEFAKAYHVSPINKRRRKGKSWCPGCYESLHRRHVREVYQRMDEAEALANGTSRRKPVKIW